MRRSDFHYELPEDRIALFPCGERSGSRLLHLHGAGGEIADRRFRDFPGLLDPRDLLVFNDTRVMPARLRGRKASGGQVEVLVERITGPGQVLAHVRASKSARTGTRLLLEDAVEAEVTGREGDLFRLAFEGDPDVVALLEAHGHMPLPPYIKRCDAEADRSRYQTVYASRPGAVAAPTAGLHFDEDTLKAVAARGVDTARVTLHVGAGTFQPVRVDNLEEHVMHREYYEVSQDVIDRIAAARRRGGRVVAVGTTVVRTLESVSAGGEPKAGSGETALFITPGYEFRCVDAMLTNFHLPESTLLMLVSAFSGYRQVMDAYRHAIRENYRFYSYGDAMFLEPAGAIAP